MKKSCSKITFISSSQHFLDIFLRDFINDLSYENKISVISNFTEKNKLSDQIKLFSIPMRRKISPIIDLYCVIKIIIIIFKIKPKKIITMTPKCIIFGILLKCIFPNLKRIHIYTGIIWTNKVSYKNLFFKIIDRLNILLSDKILFDSKEQMNFLKDHKFNNSKFFLINNGSIKGVDTSQFYKFGLEAKNAIKLRINIPIDYKVILYMGRMDIDKGILDLIKTFDSINRKLTNTKLLLVGKDEMNINKYLKKSNNKIMYLDHTDKPHEIFNIADIFCIPSYREGFGNVVIEASACEVPIIGSDIYGLKSSLKNKHNGLVFELGNLAKLESKILYLLQNNYIGKKYGEQGRGYVKLKFEKEKVLKSLRNLILN